MKYCKMHMKRVATGFDIQLENKHPDNMKDKGFLPEIYEVKVWEPGEHDSYAIGRVSDDFEFDEVYEKITKTQYNKLVEDNAQAKYDKILPKKGAEAASGQKQRMLERKAV